MSAPQQTPPQHSEADLAWYRKHERRAKQMLREIQRQERKKGQGKQHGNS